MNRKYNYRKLKPKEYNSLKRVINDIYQAAAFYNNTFINKKVTFYTKNTSITIIASTVSVNIFKCQYFCNYYFDYVSFSSIFSKF
ncbi:hypothetical protein IMAU30115_01688 [Lactobacillus helveticus]|jgi:hypothetical protein|nr:hypothetical protein [Lactobacillus helveticus]NRN83799.1 hypothetical protein [Lactobacillus helveticus]NRN85708.1 hypothetical protein [Lactobacillus helveticus]NRN87968.1 hypothetical protein [Lactobacillus helveticus]NRN97968.1 hypothetical protein [Lactobacillus helveticus]